jgi:hypothetical protein
VELEVAEVEVGVLDEPAFGFGVLSTSWWELMMRVEELMRVLKW